MTDRTETTAELDRAWRANAALWIQAVRDRRIVSRTITDAAVLDAVAGRQPRRVLDLGCGEGWLTRRLTAETGCTATGIDVEAALLAAARTADPDGDYRRQSFAEFVAAPEAAGGPYDVVVLNFALLDAAAAGLLAAASTRLTADGAVVIQTLHPWTAAGGAYRDGWRVEEFAAVAAPGEAWAPMPWYFRTLEGWLALLREAGLVVRDLREPRDGDGPPLSLLLVAEPAA